jgi:hypothetical protein
LEKQAAERASIAERGRRGGLASAQHRGTRIRTGKASTKASRRQAGAVAEAKIPRVQEAESPTDPDSHYPYLREPRGEKFEEGREPASQYVGWADVYAFSEHESHGPGLREKLDSIVEVHKQVRQTPEATLRSLEDAVREWNDGQGGRQASE